MLYRIRIGYCTSLSIKELCNFKCLGGKFERCKSMDPKPTSIIKTNSGSSLRYTSVRRHGGGGFGGQDIEKEVSK